MKFKLVSSLLTAGLLVSFAPAPSFAVAKDPVIQKIFSRINEIPINNSKVQVDPIKWVISPAVPAGYKKALVAQNQSLANRFPTLFRWKGTALVIVGDTNTWTPPEGTLSENCNYIYSRFTTGWKNGTNMKRRLIAATSYCDDHIIVIIRPDPSNPIPDGDLMAQEGYLYSCFHVSISHWCSNSEPVDYRSLGRYCSLVNCLGDLG